MTLFTTDNSLPPYPYSKPQQNTHSLIGVFVCNSRVESSTQIMGTVKQRQDEILVTREVFGCVQRGANTIARRLIKLVRGFNVFLFNGELQVIELAQVV